MPVWGSVILVLILLVLWVFSAGMRESVAALGFAGVGLWMVFCPPVTRLPAIVMAIRFRFFGKCADKKC